jgi:hypothetical protein
MSFDRIEPVTYLGSNVVFVESTPLYLQQRPSEGAGLHCAQAAIKEDN